MTKNLVHEKEKMELLEANARQKRKRDRANACIGDEEVLTIEEGFRRAQALEARQLEAQSHEAREQETRKCVFRCSVCGSTGHTARTCAQRNST